MPHLPRGPKARRFSLASAKSRPVSAKTLARFARLPRRGRLGLRGLWRFYQSGPLADYALGAEYSDSIAALTLAETLPVSLAVSPAVEITSPTRISSGWHLM